ncbi:hypothetical protein [Leifsonia sp. NCR5]|uniref:DUF6916 family protein n=1 Tax=Leifsonia sp. NCR5 TaxID=1978342 RepID=UPI00117A8A9A|nr:hypothetical protein [Leifsonia sp. NCR5]
MSRRTVMVSALSGLGVAAVAAAAPAVPAFAGTASRAAAAIPATAAAAVEPTRSLYLPAVGRAFTAVSDERTIHLTLASVDDVAGGADAGHEHRFGLHFTAAAGYEAADGIYTLTADGVPATTLFLVAIGPRRMTRSLQAIVIRNL